MTDYAPSNLIPYVPQGTLDPAAGLNEAIDVIDALLQCTVISMVLTAPPGSPSDGDRYIVAGSATGAWSGKSDYLARWEATGAHWLFYSPGTQCSLVVNGADGGIYTYHSGAWAPGFSGAGGSPVVVLTGAAYDVSALTNGAWHIFTHAGVALALSTNAAHATSALAEYAIEYRGSSSNLVITAAGGVTLHLPKAGSTSMVQDDFTVLKNTATDVWKLIGSTA